MDRNVKDTSRKHCTESLHLVLFRLSDQNDLQKVQFKHFRVLVSHPDVTINKGGVMYNSDTNTARKYQKYIQLELHCINDCECAHRIWRDETQSWRIRFSVLKRRWPRARRSESRWRWRFDRLSRFWTSKSATWMTWDRAWQNSSTNSHSSSRVASPQSVLISSIWPWFVCDATTEDKSKQFGGKFTELYLQGSVFKISAGKQHVWETS